MLKTAEPTTTQEFEEWFKMQWQPRRPVAGDTKEHAYQMSREEALAKQFIQTHSKRSKNVMVADVDFSFDSAWIILGLVEEGKILMPNWITTNPFTGNAQAGWFTAGTIGSEAGKRYFDAIYEALKLAAQSDAGYQNAKMRNPIHPNQMTQWLHSGTYTLKELAAMTPPLAPHFYTKREGSMLPEVGRNNELFNKLSAFSYREWRKPGFEVRILVEAERINQEFPEQLSLSEIVAVVSSVERFIKKHFSEAKFSAIQSRRSNLRWKGQGAATNEMLLNMVEANMSIAEIADQLGKSYDTTKKAIQRAKKAAK